MQTKLILEPLGRVVTVFKMIIVQVLMSGTVEAVVVDAGLVLQLVLEDKAVVALVKVV